MQQQKQRQQKQQQQQQQLDKRTTLAHDAAAAEAAWQVGGAALAACRTPHGTFLAAARTSLCGLLVQHAPATVGRVRLSTHVLMVCSRWVWIQVLCSTAYVLKHATHLHCRIRTCTWAMMMMIIMAHCLKHQRRAAGMKMTSQRCMHR
jgi:hypothetical protein